MVLAVPWLWAALFFLLPLAVIAVISLAQVRVGVPPYTPLLGRAGGHITVNASLDSYRMLLADSLYGRAYLGSLKIAFISTVITLIIGYPVAYGVAQARGAWRNILLLLVILPFWTSLLIRVYAWMGLLRPGGLINAALQSIGLIHQPLHLLNTTGAVYLGIVYAYLPFMILPLYARLERLDPRLREAAADLGAKPWRVFLSITLPLSLPGVVAGALLVFIPAVGEFVIPDLLGGPDTLMIGKVLWGEFFSNRDWPMSAALTVAMVVILVLPVVLLETVNERREGAP